MAKPSLPRVEPSLSDVERPVAPGGGHGCADALVANTDALLLTLVRALARQAAAEAWGEAANPRTSESDP